MKDFMKFLEEKAMKQKSPRKDEKMQAMANVSKHMSDVLGKGMSDEISDMLEKGKPSMQKVTVAASSPEALKKGLKKAEDVVSSKMNEEEDSEEMESENEEMEEESSEEESSEQESSESESEEDMSEEEIKKKISKLEDQLRELRKRS